MARNTVVISGATGLIGSALVAALADEWEVHGIARRAGSPGSAIWHELDLSTPCDFGGLPAAPDAVVYLAQSEHFREFPRRAEEIFQVNTVNLLRALEYARARGCRTFVYGSSGGVYGTGETSMSEQIEIAARGDLGFYLSSKLCSEIVAQNYTPFLGVVILRYFFVYGPGQRQSMLVPRLIQRVRGGEPVDLQGEEGIRINPVYVTDAAAATARALSLSGSHTINIGGPDVLTLRRLCETVGEAVGRSPVFRVNRSASPGHLTADIRRMREVLVAPRVPFAEGLKTML